MANDKLKIMSYNPTGLGVGKVDYIGELLDKYNIDLLLLQETWLMPNNQDRLQSINRNYYSYGTSGMQNYELVTGRPYGGLAFLWKNSISLHVKRIPSKCKRICAVSLECNAARILLINVYMPVDNFSRTVVSEELIQVCNEMESLISTHTEHLLIIGGDFTGI